MRSSICPGMSWVLGRMCVISIASKGKLVCGGQDVTPATGVRLELRDVVALGRSWGSEGLATWGCRVRVCGGEGRMGCRVELLACGLVGLCGLAVNGKRAMLGRAGYGR